jgi:hypothetical protein
MRDQSGKSLGLAGETVANLVTAKLAPGDRSRSTTAWAPTQVVVDVAGWFDAA